MTPIVLRTRRLPHKTNSSRPASWRVVAAQVKEIREEVEWLAKDAVNRYGHTIENAHVRLCVVRTFRSHTPFEFDNLVHMCKPVVDGLRFGGLIRDDDERHLEREYTQRKAERYETPGVEITVRELNEDG